MTFKLAQPANSFMRPSVWPHVFFFKYDMFFQVSGSNNTYHVYNLLLCRRAYSLSYSQPDSWVAPNIPPVWRDKNKECTSPILMAIQWWSQNCRWSKVFSEETSKSQSFCIWWWPYAEQTYSKTDKTIFFFLTTQNNLQQRETGPKKKKRKKGHWHFRQGHQKQENLNQLALIVSKRI